MRSSYRYPSHVTSKHARLAQSHSNPSRLATATKKLDDHGHNDEIVGVHGARATTTTGSDQRTRKTSHVPLNIAICAGKLVDARARHNHLNEADRQVRILAARCLRCTGRPTSVIVATRVPTRTAQLAIPVLRGAAARGQQRASAWVLKVRVGGSLRGALGFWGRSMGAPWSFDDRRPRISFHGHTAHGEVQQT
jgi:hypothetical protein